MDKNNNGFTIVELLIVIVILAILTFITIVSYIGITARAVDTSMKVDLESSAKILGIDYVNNSVYPATASEANNNKGLPLSSSSSSYSYVPNNASNPPSYTLTINNTKSENSYSITNANNVPTLITGSAPVITIPTTSSVTNSDGCGAGYFYLGLYSTATGSPTPTVQWQRLSVKNTTTGTWIDIAGATTSYYSFNSSGIITEPDYLVFRAVWTSGSFTSTSPTLQIYLTNGC